MYKYDIVEQLGIIGVPRFNQGLYIRYVFIKKSQRSSGAQPWIVSAWNDIHSFPNRTH